MLCLQHKIIYNSLLNRKLQLLNPLFSNRACATHTPFLTALVYFLSFQLIKRRPKLKNKQTVCALLFKFTTITKIREQCRMFAVPLLCTKCPSQNSAYTHLQHVIRQQQIVQFPNFPSQPRSSLSSLYATQSNYSDTKAKTDFSPRSRN